MLTVQEKSPADVKWLFLHVAAPSNWCTKASSALCPRPAVVNSLFVSVPPPTPTVAVIAALTHETDSAVSTHWYTDRKFTIVVTAVLVILPLSIPKEISFQKYARYRHSASGPTEGPHSVGSVSRFS